MKNHLSPYSTNCPVCECSEIKIYIEDQTNVKIKKG